MSSKYDKTKQVGKIKSLCVLLGKGDHPPRVGRVHVSPASKYSGVELVVPAQGPVSSQCGQWKGSSWLQYQS